MLSVQLTPLMGQCRITLILSQKFPNNQSQTLYFVALLQLFNKSNFKILSKFSFHLETLLEPID